MKFEDVEIARQRCLPKDQNLSKKRRMATLITCAIVFIIELLIICLTKPFKNLEFNSDVIPIFIIAAIILCALQIFVIGIFVLIITYSPVNPDHLLAYKQAYKTYFINQQLPKIFTDPYYNHDQGIDKKFLKETGLIRTGDIYKSNDLIRAKYKGINFLQADVEVINKDINHDADGGQRVEYETIFKGRYIIFELKKKFDFKMVISFNGYGEALINPNTGRGLNRIETESPEFNKRFLVYAEDGFEAFYILDPAFLESLERLGVKYNNALALYFSDNKLYIGLNDGGDSFEPPSISSPIDEQAELNKITNDMRLITDLIDNLKLSK